MSQPVELSAESERKRPLAFRPLDYATMVGFLAYSSSVTATPICLVAISQELSLSLAQAGGLEAVRGTLIVATLLGSGFIAASLGKAKALGWSSLLLGVGMLSYGLVPGYGALLLVMALLGLSGGVLEALINPLVQELHPNDSGRYLNLTNAFWSVGVLLTMTGTGEALSRTVSWRLIVMSLGGLGFISGVLFLCLRRTVKTLPRQTMTAVLQEKHAILQAPRFWLFTAMMFFGASAEGAFTFWSASLMQLHHGAQPRTAGIGVALFAAGMIVARLAFAWWIPQNRLWHLIVTSALFGIGFSAAIPFIDTLVTAYVALFLSGISVACFWPSLQSYAVDRIRLDPTSLFILLSCGGIAGFASISWLMGLVGDRINLQASFAVIPLCFAVLVGLLFAERSSSVKSG